MSKGKGQQAMEHNWSPLEFQLPDGKDALQTAQKCYQSTERYLYEPGELEGYQYIGERRKRSTDPIWSVDVYKIKDRYVQKHQPTLCYLDAGPK